ncbi:MAG: hypothetical protein J5706_01855 [Elusimicrobiales bacterium]|nr:hypothetical protein [Elusimicrobiales bacterium]
MDIDKIKEMVDSLSKSDRKSFGLFELLIHSIGMEISKGKKMSFDQIFERCRPLLDDMSPKLKHIAALLIEALAKGRKR